jgi:peroxiredoxin
LMKTTLGIFIILLMLLSAQPAVFGKEKATDFALTDIYGQQFSLSDYLGKVVLIDFFATSCGPCQQEMPELKSLWQRSSSEQFIMISISVDDSYVTDEVLLDFVKQYDMKWIVARDSVGVSGRYEINAIPTLIIVDSNGYIAYSHVGVTMESTLTQEIQHLLPVTTSSMSQTSTTYKTIETIDFRNYQVWFLVVMVVVVAALILFRRPKHDRQ